MRRFYFENSRGETLDLQSETLLFQIPTGLGFGSGNEYAEGAPGFWGAVSTAGAEGSITGEITIIRGGYHEYERLMHWLAVAGDIKLLYCPTPHRRLYRDIDIRSLELGEMSQAGWLVLPVEIMPKTPYYKKQGSKYVLHSGSRAEMTMLFPFEFPFIFSHNTSDSTVELMAGGEYPASFELYINGPISTPVFTVKDKSEKVYGVLDVSKVSLREGEQIYYCSRPYAEGVWKISGGRRNDLIETLDLSNNNFIRIPPGVAVSAVLSAEVPENVDRIEHVMYLHEYTRG